MKKLLLIVLIFSALQSMYAQEASLFAHYYLERTFYNPAYAGGLDKPIVHFIYRKQWQGVAGSPETFMLWGNGHIGNNIGVAGRIMRDNTGTFAQTGGRATVSYKVNLTDNLAKIHYLAFGLSLGAKMYSINFDRVGDLTDPALYNLNNTWKADGDFGMHYRFGDLDIGFAFPQLFNRQLNNNFAKNGLVRYFSESITSVSYRFGFGTKKDFHLTPLILYKIGELSNSQFDFALKASYSPDTRDFEEYDPYLWVAYLNRTDYGHIISAGFKVKNASISYAHEFGGDGIGAYSKGSNEIMLSYHFGKNEPPPPPIETPIADSLLAKNDIDSTTLAKKDSGQVKTDSSAVADNQNTDSLANTATLEAPMLDTEGKQIFPNEPKKGKRVVLRNITFETGSDKLNPNSNEALDRLADYLEKHPSLRIEIGGHTDNVGDDTFNKKLSQLRANSVMRYLVSKGIATERVITKGYGEESPLGSNDDEDDRAINRRIEMKFLEVK